ncbi:IS630 family transposase [Streptomyces sp. NPDC056670]|uniref:IS630 family transposase n=1 Tax=Streptomyces sp. NPDC056670 TaxID=3345904 RepID=UPI0036B55301
MPRILRMELTSNQEREVRERLWARDLAPGARLRLECVRLMGRGLTVPEVADLLECDDVTVRGAVHRFTAGGFDALADAPRPGCPASITREDREVLAALLDESARQGRTWTAAALCDWLAAERGVRVSPAWLTELLHRDGFRWKRTRDTLRHNADPVVQQAARAQLEDLWLDAHAGVRDLYFLDESGFAPTMPTGYTWSRAGQRAVVPREDKEGRRVNVLGALCVGAHSDLIWERTCGKIDAVMLLEFVCTSLARLPGGAAVLGRPPTGFTRVRPCTVVLDNASAHVVRVFKGRREELDAIGVELFHLPPRSPELNDIERVWRSAKYEDYPERVHTTAEAVGTAVDRALNRQRTRIKGSAANVTKAAVSPAWAKSGRGRSR